MTHLGGSSLPPLIQWQMLHKLGLQQSEGLTGAEGPWSLLTRVAVGNDLISSLATHRGLSLLHRKVHNMAADFLQIQ